MPVDWFSHPSIYAEYDYIYSNDKRVFGADSQTHSAVAGISVFTKYDILLGRTYQYSDRDADLGLANLPTNEDSHFVTPYIARQFGQWLWVGITGGYGYISTARLGKDTGSEDNWVLSPFIGISHSWGAFSMSLTTQYHYTWADAHLRSGNGGDETGKVRVRLRLGYPVTERLTWQATAEYTGMTTYKPVSENLPETHNWAEFGTKLVYGLRGPLNVYAGYAYDAFNTAYNNHNVQAGLSWSW